MSRRGRWRAQLHRSIPMASREEFREWLRWALAHAPAWVPDQSLASRVATTWLAYGVHHGAFPRDRKVRVRLTTGDTTTTTQACLRTALGDTYFRSMPAWMDALCGVAMVAVGLPNDDDDDMEGMMNDAMLDFDSYVDALRTIRSVAKGMMLVA